MATPDTRLSVLLGFFLVAAIAGAISIHFAYDERVPEVVHEELPFAPDTPGEVDPNLEVIEQVSPFGVITKREPHREAGVRKRPPGPKIIEVPAYLRGVASGWYRDAGGYQTAQYEQTRDGTPMLIYFRVDWCPSCRAFDRDVVRASEASPCYRAAVKVIINPDHGAREKQLANQYGVRGYPTILLIREPGAPSKRLSSSVRRTAGGLTADAGAFNRDCASALGM